MRTVNKIRLMFSCATLLLLPSAWADLSIFHSAIEASQTTAAPTANANTATNHSSADQLKMEAARWGLSVEDYQKYQHLMQTTPSGKWYSQLDPAEVLALNAKTDSERAHFAEIIAKNTHDRLESELAMQRAFNTAWQKLYPDLKPIAVPDHLLTHSQTSKEKLQSGDQLLFFTRLDNAENHLVLSTLLTRLNQHDDVKLAIFFVGDAIHDEDIQQWAKANNIPLKAVQSGQIILDRDHGRFNQISQNQLSLPSVILNHRGQFKAISPDQLR